MYMYSIMHITTPCVMIIIILLWFDTQFRLILYCYLSCSQFTVLLNDPINEVKKTFSEKLFGLFKHGLPFGSGSFSSCTSPLSSVHICIELTRPFLEVDNQYTCRYCQEVIPSHVLNVHTNRDFCLKDCEFDIFLCVETSSNEIHLFLSI